MKGLIIAAGQGRRLGRLTSDSPKCLIEVNGISIAQRILNQMSDAGVVDFAIVRGYLGHKFEFKNVRYFDNSEYSQNNILHSLMFAKEFLVESLENEESLIISYSDIVFEKTMIKRINKSENEITLLCDQYWESKYSGRTLHPKTEAELVIVDKSNHVRQIGKLFDEVFINSLNRETKVAEFTGLFFLKPSGIALLLNSFNKLSSLIELSEPFGRSHNFQNAYLSDFFQYLVEEGHKISAIMDSGNWFEIDTEQDLDRANLFFAKNELVC